MSNDRIFSEDDEKKCHAYAALIEAARNLFADRGFDSVSTRELAEAAGVNLGAIQYHFGSKANLFVATVRALMKDAGCECNALLSAGPVLGRKDAAVRLCRFVADLLDYTLHPIGYKACRMMFREVFTSTSTQPEMLEALVSSVVREIIAPIDKELLELLRVLSPSSDILELEYAVHSIAGQCSYYLTHGPFVNRLRGCSFDQSPKFDEVVRYVSCFSLRALRCDESLIEEALRSFEQTGSGVPAS